MTGAEFRAMKKHKSSRPQLKQTGEWVMGCECGALFMRYSKLDMHTKYSEHLREVLNAVKENA
jgi:hypothetical protein